MLRDLIRKGARRSFHFLLRAPGSGKLRRIAARLPYSRLQHVVRDLFWGEELVTLRGVRFRVNPGEVTGYYAYFLGESTDELEVLVELCRSATVFLDVGANQGFVALALARECPALTVVGFEPDRAMAERFRMNLGLNGDLRPRVSLAQQAVADHPGRMRFSPSSNAFNSAIGRLAAAGQTDEGYDVEVCALADFCRDAGLSPEVVKIDVEGGEIGVLRGMATLTARPKAVLVETHGFYSGADCDLFNAEVVAELRRQGFHIRRLVGSQLLELRDPSELGARGHLLAT